MTRISWTTRAQRDLVEMRTYLEQFGQDVADRQSDAVIAAVRWLAARPNIGAPIGVTAFRKWRPRTGHYLIVYRIEAGLVIVLRVPHEQSNWLAAFSE